MIIGSIKNSVLGGRIYCYFECAPNNGIEMNVKSGSERHIVKLL